MKSKYFFITLNQVKYIVTNVVVNGGFEIFLGPFSLAPTIRL